MSNDVETLSKLLEKSSMALLRTVIPSFAESIAKSNGITDRKKIDELADILKGTPEDEQRAAEISDEYRNAKKKIEAMSATDRAALFETSLNELKPLLIDAANVYGQQRDKFIAQGVKDAPGTIDAAVMVCRDAIDSAVVFIATMGGANITLFLGLLPPEAMHNAETMRKAKEIAASFLDVETTAQYILDAMPETMGYLRQHAPAIAGTLETHARRKIQESTSPLWEYFDSVIEAAEPIEEKKNRAEQEAEYGNTDLIPIDAHREPKDKLTQMLFGGKIKIGDVKKAINVNTDTRPVHTYLSVIPDPDFMEGIRPIYGKGDLCFSREHWRFYRAIMTEILQGNEWTTFQRLYQIEYHQLGRTRPGAISKEKEKEMMDMLYFFQKQFIEADITGEKAYYKKNAGLQSMDDVPKGALVNFEIWPHYINHNKVDNAIHFLNIPILLKYALAHNHIATIPPKLFQNKAFKRQTEDASDVADMLIHWLMMKNVRNYELAYETVFNYMGVKSSDKTAAAKSRRTRLRNIVFKWMNYWSKDLHLFSWDANNAQYIKIILPKDELEKKKHTLFTAEKIKALM